MLQTDFKKYDIDNFTLREIERTGASLIDVNVKLIVSLQKLRRVLKTTFILLKNGITTGKHSSKIHKRGLAVDFYPKIAKKYIEYNDYKNWIYQAIKCGFSGIGVYYCHEVEFYTLHLDLRGKFTTWTGTKERKIDNWEYSNLIVDMKGN